MNDIESYLPHRAPFLFVDEVSVKEDTIFAEHTFRADDWFFKGHFPAFPVVPGVLLVESMAQAGGVGAKLMGIYPKSLLMFAKIKDARFKQPVHPGDTLKMESRMSGHPPSTSIKRESPRWATQSSPKQSG